MAQIKTLVLRAPGSNCDEETAFAFQQAGAVTSLVHISRLIWAGKLKTLLPAAD
jgi:phosphoribosylformylglycinamidine synthase